jgi:hypothetical protein
MSLCHWCNNLAAFYFKTTKRWCCSPFAVQCPVFKKKKATTKTPKVNTPLITEYTGFNKKRRSKHKKGAYKGHWCDSSWELAWVIYHLDHNIQFERNIEKFPYIYRKRKYKWLPDFIINGTFIEIKGWMTKRNQAKIDCFQMPLIVLRYQDLKPILKYVADKYGKDFINLYE